MLFKSILLFILIAVFSYIIGTINFSKIIAWRARRRDITKIGSHNPGTMNMLRSFGFGLALLTFCAEILKSGLTCFLLKLLFNHFEIWGGGEFVYYLAGFFIMIGYNFPIWSKFKGGKGVANFVGIFLFSTIWYISLGWFVICFILFLFIEYGSVVSLTYTGGLTIATILYSWLSGVYSLWVSIYITAMVTVLYILTLYKHRGNIKRLISGTENRVDFKDKLKKFFAREKVEPEEPSTEEESQSSNQEIVIDSVERDEAAPENYENKDEKDDEITKENKTNDENN